jgi:hypothetical protein
MTGAPATMVLLAPLEAGARRSAARPIPTLAYYYIWYNPSSWSRGKSDYPVLGRYSSDNRSVMAQHVRWARSAGIDGFIVSWKDTPALDARLAKLIKVADAMDFKLAIIYQGLNFSRKPIGAARVASDLRFFVNRFAGDRAFRIYSKPLVIWSGTWAYTTQEIADTAGPLRDNLTILASEKNVQGYQRVAHYVDGDAYYWSSVNPQRYPHYPDKLIEMGKAVHHDLGLWIAPAAPGFDARLVGGTSVVPRRNGATLREELDGALASSPDAIGLISWNEFSENSAVEPSKQYGLKYLHILRDAIGGPSTTPSIRDFNSDGPVGNSKTYSTTVAVTAVAILLGLVVLVLMRSSRRRAGRAG